MPTGLRQIHLGKVIKSIFPGKNILNNARKSTHIASDKQGYYLELDFFIPELKLAFEFQDPHHYVTTTYSHDSLTNIKSHDRIKQEIVEERGDTLIVVPCWWDGHSDSLIATIKQKRPELFLDKESLSSPIAQEPPENFFEKQTIPGVGELMQPSFVSSIHHENKNWWLSEKYDGIRACWSNNQLYTRAGNKIEIANSLLKLFPHNVVDGEIWFGRNQYPETRQLLSGEISNLNSNWSHFRFVAFDCPNLESIALPFESRFGLLAKIISYDHSFMVTEAHTKSNSKEHVVQFTKLVLKGGGEGLIMRKSQSTHESGRSRNLLKLKAHRDQEGLVEQVEEDGSFLLQSTEGELVKAKLAADWWDYKLPKTGDVVSYYVANAPIRVLITKIRNDVMWDTENSENQGPHAMSVSRISKKALKLPSLDHQVRGFWTENENENMVLFFKNFAETRNLDPLLPSSWYNVKNSEIIQEGGSSILNHYGNSFAKALMDLFPNIGLDSRKFISVPQNHWDVEQNRKVLLEEFMQRKNLDPLLASDWYSVSNESLIAMKGGLSVLNHYEGSLFRAIRHLFPSLKIEELYFYKINQKYWQNIGNRRQVLIDVAIKKGINFEITEDWYSMTTADVIAEQGGPAVLHQYGGSLVKALTSLFSHLNLDPLKIDSITMLEQVARNKKKNFFMAFATKHKFDPLIAGNWYSFSTFQIRQEQGGKAILQFYKDLPAALGHVFPSIGIVKEKFKYNTQ